MADDALMPHKRLYQLTLTFAAWANDDLLTSSPDEGQLDDDELLHLKANRSLLAALLHNPMYHHILEELFRKRVLEEAEVMVDDLKGQLLLNNLPDEALIRPIIDGLSVDVQDTKHMSRCHVQEYLQDASEDGIFEEVAGEAISSIGVELEGAHLGEIEHEDSTSYYLTRERTYNEKE